MNVHVHAQCHVMCYVHQYDAWDEGCGCWSTRCVRCLNVMFQTTERNYDSLLLQLLIIRHPQLRVREHRPRSLHVLEPLGRLRLIRGGVGVGEGVGVGVGVALGLG